MHFEVLVEDQSGKKALDILVPKIVGDGHTVKVHDYKGSGHIPKNLRSTSDSSKRILLDQLPRLLRGFGKTYASYTDYPTAVIVVCDLDAKCLKAFRQELVAVLHACNPSPETRFCIAVEEGEAWLLGDPQAIMTAYPKASVRDLNAYLNDSIVGTWERLADAVFPGGSQALSAKGSMAIGAEKSQWAKSITPHMDVNNNDSPSFCYLCDKLRELAV